MLTISYWQ